MYNFANKSWRVQIKEDIERLIENAEDFEELLELLENEGYLINRGKYVSVKTFGMKRFVRLKTIDDGKYSEKNLRQRIRSIRYRTYQDQSLESKHILYKNISEGQKSNKIDRNKLSGYMSLQQYKMKTFINKQDALANNLTDENSSEYYKRRYLIVKEINQINKVFEIMNSEKINSYNDVDQRILQYEDDYSFLKRNYDNLKIHKSRLQG